MIERVQLAEIRRLQGQDPAIEEATPVSPADFLTEVLGAKSPAPKPVAAQDVMAVGRDQVRSLVQGQIGDELPAGKGTAPWDVATLLQTPPSSEPLGDAEPDTDVKPDTEEKLVAFQITDTGFVAPPINLSPQTTAALVPTLILSEMSEVGTPEGAGPRHVSQALRPILDPAPATPDPTKLQLPTASGPIKQTPVAAQDQKHTALAMSAQSPARVSGPAATPSLTAPSAPARADQPERPTKAPAGLTKAATAPVLPTDDPMPNGRKALAKTADALKETQGQTARAVEKRSPLATGTPDPVPPLTHIVPEPAGRRPDPAIGAGSSAALVANAETQVRLEPGWDLALGAVSGHAQAVTARDFLPSRQAAYGFRLSEFDRDLDKAQIGPLAQALLRPAQTGTVATGTPDKAAKRADDPSPKVEDTDSQTQMSLQTAGSDPAAGVQNAGSAVQIGAAFQALPAMIAAHTPLRPPAETSELLGPGRMEPPVSNPGLTRTADPLTAQVAHLVVNRAEDRAEVLLEPAELGRLRFEITHRGDGVQIVLSAERPETMDLMRRHSDQLREEFRAMGFGGAELGFGSWGDGQAKPQTASWADPNFGPDITPAISHPTPAAPPSNSGSGGLDLRL